MAFHAAGAIDFVRESPGGLPVDFDPSHVVQNISPQPSESSMQGWIDKLALAEEPSYEEEV